MLHFGSIHRISTRPSAFRLPKRRLGLRFLRGVTRCSLCGSRRTTTEVYKGKTGVTACDACGAC